MLFKLPLLNTTGIHDPIFYLSIKHFLYLKYMSFFEIPENCENDRLFSVLIVNVLAFHLKYSIEEKIPKTSQDGNINILYNNII